MKFSTKSTYGLRAITYLAQNNASGQVSLATIAAKEHISLGYLERIFAQLKKAKLVEAAKGAAGGYRLARSPRTISALEIINTLEGQKKLFYCLGENGKVYCSQACHCGANKALSRVQAALHESLKKIKLSELISS